MTAARVYEVDAVEDCTFTLLGRFCAKAATGAVSPFEREGKLIKRADVSSISVKFYTAAGAQIGSTLTPTATATISDTLQTAETYAALNGGGNFSYDVAGTYVPTGGAQVRGEVLITLTDGSVCPGLYAINVLPLVQS